MLNPETSIPESYLDRLLNDADTDTKIFWGKELVTSFRLSSGFTVLGKAACVDPENFQREIGLEIARKDALCQLWALEGYVLQLRLAGLIADNRQES